MSIEASNRVSDPNKNRAYAIRNAVVADELHRIGTKRRMRKGYDKHFHRKAAICSQCKRGMDNNTARQQIENKRENAPICIPCILGQARKPLPINGYIGGK